MINFHQQKFLVTGATSGIGEGVARVLNQHGAFVVLVGRRLEKLQKVQSSLAFPTQSELIVFDLEKPFSLKSILTQSVEKSGKFTGMVNAAGVDSTKPLKLLSNKDFDALFLLNITTPFSIVKELTHKNIFSDEGGSIVFISSVMGSYGQKGKIAYSASKAAIKGMVASMALELANKKIRVNSVSPGIVETPLTEKLFKILDENAQKEIERKHPLGFGKVDDVANLVAFLLSKQAAWITGSDYFIDGGYHLNP
jgi:NAD(P)-dependent dehydrogenase (short-subunit alcohol dehydrogenase family)